MLTAVLSAPAAQAQRHYVPIANALSAATLTQGITVAPRAFAPSQFLDACNRTRPVTRFKVIPRELVIGEGRDVSLYTISIVAVDAADLAVPGVALVLEAEDDNPPVVQLQSNDPYLRVGRLRAAGPGTFRIRVRTVCAMPLVETEIRGRVGIAP